MIRNCGGSKTNLTEGNGNKARAGVATLWYRDGKIGLDRGRAAPTDLYLRRAVLPTMMAGNRKNPV